MIAFTTILLVSVMCSWGIVQYRMEPARVPGRRLHTFLVDPPTMFVVGLASVLVGLLTRKGRKLPKTEFLARRRIVDILQYVFLLGFWTFELLTYFDVLGHPFDPARSGNDFMWNGYVEWLAGPIFHGPFPTYRFWWSWPVLAGFLFLQWAALRFGRAVGYMAARLGDPDRR